MDNMSNVTPDKENVEEEKDVNGKDLFTNITEINQAENIENLNKQNIGNQDTKVLENFKIESLIENQQTQTSEEQRANYEKLKSYIKWNSIEELYNSKYFCFCGREVDLYYIPTKSFTEALMEKLRISFIGCFLDHLNSPQRKDYETYSAKAELTEVIYNKHEDFNQERNNDVCKDVIGLIKNAVEKRKVINTELVFSCMWNARLVDCMVTNLDSGVKKLKQLEMLSLPANWISDLKGSLLPRNLKFLELFCNLINDFTNLCRGFPSTLCHLGLARNKLTDGSNLHLLATINTTYNLRTLDLGDNDICDLLYVLNSLTSLVNLVGLTLHGNPCSTCSTYRETILKYLPKLKYLDNVEFWSMDREPLNDCKIEDHVEDGALIFKCFRLMGIPQPAAQTVDKQKVEQTYHIEIELPLLDPELRKIGQLEPTDPEFDILSSVIEKEKVNKK
ncbi:hypothetical protein L9F63_017659, partial [Diploptera punctata]